jgi:hypothetical protein
VAEDEDARCRMGTALREFYDAHGDALAELAHGPRRGHGLSPTGPSRVQIQRSPLSSQGPGGRGQGGHAPSCNTRGRRAQQAGRDGRPRQVPAPAAELRSQARQPALHVHLWLDHMKALPKGSASSKRAAADQGGPGLPATVMGARRANTPSMQHSTSHLNSTAPLAGKRPTPHVSAASSRS